MPHPNRLAIWLATTLLLSGVLLLVLAIIETVADSKLATSEKGVYYLPFLGVTDVWTVVPLTAVPGLFAAITGWLTRRQLLRAKRRQCLSCGYPRVPASDGPCAECGTRP